MTSPEDRRSITEVSALLKNDRWRRSSRRSIGLPYWSPRGSFFRIKEWSRM